MRRTAASKAPARRPAQVAAAVRPLADETCREAGLVLWDVAFERQAGRDTLRVACDRPGGVSSDELARLAERLSRALDRTDAVPGDAPYTLDVSSPGAERRLETTEHFEVCRGRRARVRTRDGRTLEGVILGAGDEAVALEAGGGVVEVALADVVSARLVVSF